jgi:hypothetical protein
MKKEDNDASKVAQSELKEAWKQVNNLTNQMIGVKKVEQGHLNQMVLNEQRQTMNVVSHAAKLGGTSHAAKLGRTIAQTKAELLAQSQLQKAQQFRMYSANIGGMHGIGSGGVQVPHMAMMNAMGGNNGMMNNSMSSGMMNGLRGGNGGFNPFQGMALHQQQPFMMARMQSGMLNGMMPPTMAGMQNRMMPNVMAGMQNVMMSPAMAGMQNGMMPNMMAGMQNGMAMNGMQNGMAMNGMMPPIMQAGGMGIAASQNPAMPSPDAANQNPAVPPPTAAFQDQVVLTHEDAANQILFFSSVYTKQATCKNNWIVHDFTGLMIVIRIRN